MSRAARILAELESERSVSADDLADSIVVSRRTIANEIATLQYLMGTAASITLTDGRYHLLIADPPRYRAGLLLSGSSATSVFSMSASTTSPGRSSEDSASISSCRTSTRDACHADKLPSTRAIKDR